LHNGSRAGFGVCCRQAACCAALRMGQIRWDADRQDALSEILEYSRQDNPDKRERSRDQPTGEGQVSCLIFNSRPATRCATR
jgi:hypothetical protein